MFLKMITVLKFWCLKQLSFYICKHTLRTSVYPDVRASGLVGMASVLIIYISNDP